MSYLINSDEILQTINMIDQQHLDVRIVTMGISLLDCADPDTDACCRKITDKICRYAENLVPVCEQIERELGIPIVNKRISVTPVSIVAAGCDTGDYLPLAKAMDKAAKEVGVNFIGGFSALCHKGFTESDIKLIRAIPRALTETDLVCSSVNVASTKAGINMDAVSMMGKIIKEMSEIDPVGCFRLNKDYFSRTNFLLF